jgi:hypothetical protein
MLRLHRMYSGFTIEYLTDGWPTRMTPAAWTSAFSASTEDVLETDFIRNFTTSFKTTR